MNSWTMTLNYDSELWLWTMTLNSSSSSNSIHLITSYAEIYNMKTEILIQVGVCANCRFLVHSGTIHYAGGILKLLFHGIFWTEPLLDWTFLELNSFWTELFLSWTLFGLNSFWTELLLNWTSFGLNFSGISQTFFFTNTLYKNCCVKQGQQLVLPRIN